LVIKASGVGVFDELLEREVLNLRREGHLVMFWDVDAPATLERLQQTPEDPFRALIPKYDIVLTYGGGEPVVLAYQAHGARQCVPIYNALDPATHYRVAAQPRFESDFAFLGNRLPDREQRVEEFFFAPATMLPGWQMLLAGNGWAGKCMPPNVRDIGHLYTADHNAFNSTPTALLNVNRESMARYGYSPPTRIFEAAGAAACIISDRWKGLDSFLEPGQEVLTAGDREEVIHHLQSLTQGRAREIGLHACRRIMAHHTYTKRVEQLERVLDL
jgi:spore maturation protein CgeB